MSPNELRPIPAALWNAIAEAKRTADFIGTNAKRDAREHIIRAAAPHGFTARELEMRGLIEEDTSAILPDNKATRVHVGRSKRDEAR
jgi:hypothetical protein